MSKEPENQTADLRVVDFLRLKAMRLRAACQEIITREREELSDIPDVNCYGAGWSGGAINAAKKILACMDEEDAVTNEH